MLPTFTSRLTFYLAAAVPVIIGFAPRGMAALLAVFTLLLLAGALQQRQTWLDRLNNKSLLPSLLPVLGALALIAASAFYSDSPRAFEMLRDTLYVSLCTLVLYHLARLWPANTIGTMHRILAISFGIVLALFTVNVLADFPFQHLTGNVPDDGRLIFESNVPKRSAALFVIFMWPVALGLWLRGQRRWAFAALIGTAALSLLFNSSTAMLAAFAGLLVLGLCHYRVRIGQSLGLALLPLGFILTIVLALSAPNLPAAITDTIKASGDYRLQIWNFVARQSLQHLPFGIGLDGSRVLPSQGEYAAFMPPDAADATTVTETRADILPDHPHNVYLQIWLELGVAGVALAMLFTWLLWQRLCAVPRRLQPFVWGYVITAVITLALAYGAWQAWWLAGHGLAAILFAAQIRTYQEEA